jgi:hypothetical protein
MNPKKSLKIFLSLSPTINHFHIIKLSYDDATLVFILSHDEELFFLRPKKIITKINANLTTQLNVSECNERYENEQKSCEQKNKINIVKTTKKKKSNSSGE